MISRRSLLQLALAGFAAALVPWRKKRAQSGSAIMLGGGRVAYAPFAVKSMTMYDGQLWLGASDGRIYVADMGSGEDFAEWQEVPCLPFAVVNLAAAERLDA